MDPPHCNKTSKEKPSLDCRHFRGLQANRSVPIFALFHYRWVLFCNFHRMNKWINWRHGRWDIFSIYSDKLSYFEALLEKEGSVTSRHKNLQVMTIEMYKVLRGLTPTLFNESVEAREYSNCNLRHITDLIIPRRNSVN